VGIFYLEDVQLRGITAPQFSELSGESFDSVQRAASIRPHAVPDSPDNVFSLVAITSMVAGCATEPRKTLEVTTMSFDGIPKLAHFPHVSTPDDASTNMRKKGQRHERICEFCAHPISRRQHPVVLKSGKSVHLDCYLQMPKRPRIRGRNSK
jgi:hypothetical protein